MRAHQIMTRKVITVKADTSILEAANLMLQHHISGLPVVDETGRLLGIVSEGDFMRRSEIGTQGPRIRWLDFLMGAGKSALDFVREHGRKVGEIMTRDDLFTATEDMPLEELVRLMERQNVKRLPVAARRCAGRDRDAVRPASRRRKSCARHSGSNCRR